MNTKPILKISRSQRLLDAALFYRRELSWSVIPVEPRGKRPLVQWEAYQRERATEDQVRAWWTEHPTANVGIVTGQVSGIVVLDVDGPEGAATLEQQPEIDPTAMSSTSRGPHLFFKHPGDCELRNFARRLPGLDFRGDGGYIVAPPSVHPSGQVYTWGLGPHQQPPADLPAWLRDLIQSNGRTPAPPIGERIPDHTRNVTLTSSSRSASVLLEFFTMTKQLILDYFAGDFSSFYRRFLPDLPTDRDTAQVLCPFHDDRQPSLSVNLRGRHAGSWRCFGACGERGSFLDFYARKHGIDCRTQFKAVLEGVAREFGILLPDNGRAKPSGMPKPIRTLAERGISAKTAQAFRIREESGDHQVTHRIVFPVIDPHGQVIGEKVHKAGNSKAPPIQLYPWGVLKKDGLIFLVNGEPSVWRAYEAGYRNALCCTGGEENFKTEWAEHFRGKPVRIVYDRDETGTKGTERTARLLHGKAASVEVVVWPEGTPEKCDAEDWLKAGHRLEDLQFKAWEPAPKIATVTPPQARRVDFPLELSDSVWRGVVTDYRDMLAKTTEASDAFSLFSFLTCVGSVVGRRVFVRYGLPVYSNLYTCLVGKSGESRKTTSLRHGERTVREADPEWRILRGLSSAEGLLAQIADPWTKQNTKGVTVAEGGTRDKRLLVWLSELSTLLKKAKQDSVSNLLPLLAEAYDGPPALNLPTKADPITCTEPHISLLAASTPAWLEDLQDRDIMAGFANRFAFVLGEPKPPIAWPSPPDAGLYAKITAHISDVLLWLPDSLEVRLTGEARDLWTEFYVRWKAQTWPDEMFAALVQRIPDIALKIALIYAVLEKRAQIDADTLTAAIDAGGYCVASAQRIFTDFHSTRASKLEARVLEVLKAGPVKSWVLHQAVGGRNSADEINRAIDALCRVGRVSRVGQGERGADIFSLVPEDEG